MYRIYTVGATYPALFLVSISQSIVRMLYKNFFYKFHCYRKMQGTFCLHDLGVCGIGVITYV